jgi:hypothetical protein
MDFYPPVMPGQKSTYTRVQNTGASSEEVGPDTAWPLILRLVEKGSDAVLGAVGAGVLEELLDRYSVDVIERIEAQARRDSRFRLCLSHVWPSAMPAEIWQRVVVARGDEPQRG